MAPKSKKSKKQDDNWDEGLGEVADPIAQAEAEAKAAEAQADADEDDNAGGGGLMAALKKNKEKRKKKGKTTDNDFVEGEDPAAEETSAVDLAAKAPVEASMDDEFDQPKKNKQAKGSKQQKADEEDEGDGKMKTKAEKEKEKKERQKQKKKEEAAKKKSTPAPVQEKEAAPAPVESKVEAPGKKKKLNPVLAALQKQQEELRRRQEEDAQLAAAEKARIEQDEKNAAEEEARRVEARAAKKEKEKKKIEDMKKAGTYKTEKQKKDEAQAKLRLQQMLDSGVAKVEGVDGAEQRTTKKDERRKRNPKKEAEERRAKEEAEQQQRALELRQKEEQAKRLEEEAAKAKQNAEEKKDEESEEEDWEALADKDDVKDSWDAPSDEEDVKPAPAKAPVKPAADEDDDEDDDSDEDSEEDSDDSEDEVETAGQRQARERREQAQAKRQQELEAARAAASTDNLRSPISCILGHVDVGKTKLLDKIRQTNVQDQEVGGITQQIGATYFPVDALRQKTAVVNPDNAFEFKIPGLLIIDTPGHESFSNLRSRGSSLCNIAILVVDILHLLEPQTLESLRLLKERKTPFIVALNKIDRLYDWKAIPNNGFKDSLSKQKGSVQGEFADRLNRTKVAFAEQGFNAELFYENKSLAKNVSLVPTSAHTGEGVPDLLKLLCMLTQERMTKQLMYLSHAEATVLEVKEIQGLGVTIDVILSNGILREGDTCVVSGTDGPIRFVIRALLTPGDMRELRVKANYVHNKVVKASLGVKIAANGLETAIAGSRLLVAKDPEDEDELEDLEEDVMGDLEGLMSKITKSGRGVTVQASTLGSLEALLEFLKSSKIPVGSIGIGPVHKRDVITASTALEKAPEYAVMLCFDVKVDKEAQELADQMGVTIFAADIIYHLFDKFTKHMKELADKRKEESKMLAVFPCVLRPVAVFNKTNPIVVGVDVIEGSLRLTTPIAAVRVNPTTKAKEVIELGRVTSIERDHKQLTICKKGQPSVAVKIEMANQVAYGRHLVEDDTLYSQISRKSIDTLKEFFREDVEKDDWQLIAKSLKPLFDIS